MKKNKLLVVSRLTILIIVFFLFRPLSGFSQDALPVMMEVSTWKYSDNTREIIASLIAENDDGEFAAEGLTVNFTMQDGDDFVELASATSDADGNAILLIEAGFDFPKDEDAYINIFSVFEGNNNYDAAEAELAFKDVLINISFIEEDETKYIAFAGEILGPDGENFPLADDDIYFFVPRMFSYLKIAEGWLEENGEGMVEYPTKIIGDSLGRLEVIARITEHYDYGNIEKSSVVDWAIPSTLIAAERPVRELWSPIAPMWMIVTLIIMLAGVWGHYIYAMYELYMIRKIGKKESKG
jgi:hypothetical protein